VPLASADVPPYGRVWSTAGQSGGLVRLSEEVEEYFDIGLSLGPDDVVVDVGANVGLFALAVRRRVQGVRYYAFEPVPALYRALEENVLRGAGSDGPGTAKLFPVALGEREDERDVDFFYFKNFPSDSTRHIGEKRDQFERFWSWALGRGPTGIVMRPIVRVVMRSRFGHWLSDMATGMERVQCRATTLSRVIETEGLERIDVLKIDVEGAELDVLGGISSVHWARVRQLALEGHDEGDRLPRVKELLARHGFDHVELRTPEGQAERELNNYLLLARRTSDSSVGRTSDVTAPAELSTNGGGAHGSGANGHGNAGSNGGTR
jgi:FkbM family methyltransferase